MKIAILGDLHLGVKDDDAWVQQNQRDFFEFFFGECEEQGIKTIFQLGDWFDVRRGLSQETLMFQREYLNPKLMGYETYGLVGNHDMHLREEITPNSMYEVLSTHPNIHVVEKPTMIRLGGVDFDFIPWMCKENTEEVAEFVGQSSADYCLGHFELNGFYFARGQKSSGIDGGFLSRYDQVWSGHFHTISTNGNIRYMGTPYTLTMADADDPRGFHIFDTETRELTFVENPVCHHTKLYFNADTFDTKSIESFANKAVKIIVEKRSSDERKKINFDAIEERMAQVVHQLQTLDEIDLVEHVADDVKTIKDIDTYVDEYVETLDESSEVKERVRTIFKALYREAKDLE